MATQIVTIHKTPVDELGAYNFGWTSTYNGQDYGHVIVKSPIHSTDEACIELAQFHAKMTLTQLGNTAPLEFILE